MHDLHTHSLCSDGILRPQELVSRARAKGVQTLALTDHDTVEGIEEARQAAVREGITLIPGIEFSCLWDGVGVHIVGLNIDPGHPLMQAAVARQQQSREERAHSIAEKLAKVGIAGALEGARAHASGNGIGRPHFAHFMVEQGHVASVSAAFQKYLGSGKVGDVKQLWPEVSQAVEWIRGAGGVAVVAHPDKYKVTRTKLRRLLAEFAEAGGQALEVISGQQSPAVSRDLLALAQKYDLSASCGSDFHVPGQPWQELGNFGQLPPGSQPVWELWQAA